MQQAGVLVNVGLVGYTGSVTQLASQITLANLNNQLNAMGLRSAQGLQVLAAAVDSTTGSRSRPSNPLLPI